MQRARSSALIPATHTTGPVGEVRTTGTVEQVGDLLRLAVHAQGAQDVARAWGVDPEPAAQAGVDAAGRRVEKNRGAGPLATVGEGECGDVGAGGRR